MFYVLYDFYIIYCHSFYISKYTYVHKYIPLPLSAILLYTIYNNGEIFISGWCYIRITCLYIYSCYTRTIYMYISYHISFGTAKNKKILLSFLYGTEKKYHIHIYMHICMKIEQFNYPHTDGLPLFFIL